jgi:hypothetical protein
MSNPRLMEEVLSDLLVDLQPLHQATKSERLKLRIEKYVERILQALRRRTNRGRLRDGQKSKDNTAPR